MKNSSSPTSGPLSFERYGRSYHLEIEGADALSQILELDEAHWVATNAPIETINADPEFLALLDTDHDRRIRSAEVKQAILWLLNHLHDTSGVKPNNTTLELAAIQRESRQGRRIYNSAMKILRRNNTSDTSYVTLEEVRRIKKREEEGGIDTAGMVLSTAAPDDYTREFLDDIIATVGGEPHPGGGIGVTRERMERFLTEIQSYHDWFVQADLPEDHSSSAIMSFGRDTATFYTLFIQIREKIDQYFAICDIMQMSPEAAEQMRQQSSQLQDVDFSDSQAMTTFLAKAWIAWPTTDGTLHFEATINPYYAESLQQFRTKVLPLILEQTPKTLSPEQWGLVKEQFIPYQTWIESKPHVSVESLTREKVQRYLDSSAARETLHTLIQESYKTAFVLDNLRLLEQLILYQAHMIPFVNSFVSFPHLYDPESRALFEEGTLIMDGRHFTLSAEVLDREQHIKFSQTSNMFVLYVEVSAKEGEKLYEVAVPVTSGMRGNLQVNKRGIFRDIHGVDLHAKVVHIVENPISFFEAISAPFRRLGRAVTAKLDEISLKAEERLEALTLLKKIQTTSTPRIGQTTGGILAAGSIAIAALSSSFAFITKTLSGLGWSVILGGVLATIIAVMLPTLIVAYLKLSKRDLSCILEGSGWAINARMWLTRKQAHTFTFKPPYPPHSKGILLQRWWRRKGS